MGIAIHLALGSESAAAAETQFADSFPAQLRKPMLHARICKQFERARDCGFRMEAEFKIPPGVMILFGPSGAGKSTLEITFSTIHSDISTLSQPSEASRSFFRNWRFFLI
jgi:ABC-type transport system involved in cytochrome bd biosynthesis fused ATPase/permease subunit